MNFPLVDQLVNIEPKEYRMTSSSAGHFFGNICVSCVVTALVIIAIVSAATLLWVSTL